MSASIILWVFFAIIVFTVFFIIFKKSKKENFRSTNGNYEGYTPYVGYRLLDARITERDDFQFFWNYRRSWLVAFTKSKEDYVLVYHRGEGVPIDTGPIILRKIKGNAITYVRNEDVPRVEIEK